MPRDQPGRGGEQNTRRVGLGGGNADDKAGGGNQTVICPKHGGPQPAGAVGAVMLPVAR